MRSPAPANTLAKNPLSSSSGATGSIISGLAGSSNIKPEGISGSVFTSSNIKPDGKSGSSSNTNP